MKKLNFSVEILYLFFIISISILFGKVLLDVRNAIGSKINQFMPQPTVQVEYKAYSYNDNDALDALDELIVIRTSEELESFENKLKDEKIEASWLKNKLKNYEDDFFTTKTLVVVTIVNENDVSFTRIGGVTKKNDYISITVNQKTKAQEATAKYTWLAILEIEDIDSKITIDIGKD